MYVGNKDDFYCRWGHDQEPDVIFAGKLFTTAPGLRQIHRTTVWQQRVDIKRHELPHRQFGSDIYPIERIKAQIARPDEDRG